MVTEGSKIWRWLLVVLDEEILIEDLHPSTSYVFQVRARNEVGVGLQKRITVTTDDVRKFSRADYLQLTFIL